MPVIEIQLFKDEIKGYLTSYVVFLNVIDNFCRYERKNHLLKIALLKLDSDW